jgi:hypothetical protein
MKALFRKINTCLFLALALFPVLDFAILNVITGLFIITMPFTPKVFFKIPKGKVLFILAMFSLSLFPVLTANFQCDIGYWVEKVLPIYITSILVLITPGFITQQNYRVFINIYIIGVVVYVFKFVAIVLIEVYSGNLGIIFEKKFLFYSDIMNLLRSEIDVLDSNYHKPYMSLIILLALYFVTRKLLKETTQKTLYFCLVLFFLAAVIFPLSLPNIGLVCIYLIYLIYKLIKQKRGLQSFGLLIGAAVIVILFFYKSFEHNNIDITEDVAFLMDVIKEDDQRTPSISLNPRKIIYSALLRDINLVPFLGYGYCEGKNTVTTTVESHISLINSDGPRRNLLVDSEAMNSHLWQKKGVNIKAVDSAFLVSEQANDCLSHTWFQILDDLEQQAEYTFSASFKSDASDVVIRLGKLNDQMAVYDTSKNQWSFLGKDILNYSIQEMSDGYQRIGITTNVFEDKSIALLGFIGENNSYNHCQNQAQLLVKHPQLEMGSKQSAYNIGFSKNESNILGAKINAHNVFLQHYYFGGIIAVFSILLLYGWFLYLAKANGDQLMFIFVLTLLFNSLFEYIQYRQIGISIIIVTSILLMFKKKER